MKRLDNWRKDVVEEIVLPSGNAALVRKVKLLDLAVNGKIPVPLLGTVEEMVGKGENLTVDDMTKFGDVLNIVVKASFVDPAVADNGDDTHLGIDEISFTDKIEVFRWANEEGYKLAPFRQEQERVFTSS